MNRTLKLAAGAACAAVLFSAGGAFAQRTAVEEIERYRQALERELALSLIHISEPTRPY